MVQNTISLIKNSLSENTYLSRCRRLSRLFIYNLRICRSLQAVVDWICRKCNRLISSCVHFDVFVVVISVVLAARNPKCRHANRADVNVTSPFVVVISCKYSSERLPKTRHFSICLLVFQRNVIVHLARQWKSLSNMWIQLAVRNTITTAVKMLFFIRGRHGPGNSWTWIDKICLKLVLSLERCG